jgi:hypothetical protein
MRYMEYNKDNTMLLVVDADILPSASYRYNLEEITCG